MITGREIWQDCTVHPPEKGFYLVALTDGRVRGALYLGPAHGLPGSPPAFQVWREGTDAENGEFEIEAWRIMPAHPGRVIVIDRRRDERKKVVGDIRCSERLHEAAAAVERGDVETLVLAYATDVGRAITVIPGSRAERQMLVAEAEQAAQAD